MRKLASIELQIDSRRKREVETILAPRHREKHFLVTRVINPETPVHQIEAVEIGAVLTHRRYLIPWRELEYDGQWRPGGV